MAISLANISEWPSIHSRRRDYNQGPYLTDPPAEKKKPNSFRSLQPKAAPSDAKRSVQGSEAAPSDDKRSVQGSEAAPSDDKRSVQGSEAAPSDDKRSVQGPEAAPSDDKRSVQGSEAAPSDDKRSVQGSEAAPSDDKRSVQGSEAAPSDDKRSVQGSEAAPSDDKRSVQGSEAAPSDDKRSVQGPEAAPSDDKRSVQGSEAAPSDDKRSVQGSEAAPSDDKRSVQGSEAAPSDDKRSVQGSEASPSGDKRLVQGSEVASSAVDEHTADGVAPATSSIDAATAQGKPGELQPVVDVRSANPVSTDAKPKTDASSATPAVAEKGRKVKRALRTKDQKKDSNPRVQQIRFMAIIAMIKDKKYDPYDFYVQLKFIPAGKATAELRDEQGMTLIHRVIHEGRGELLSSLFYHGSWAELSKARVQGDDNSSFRNLLPAELIKNRQVKLRNSTVAEEFALYDAVNLSCSDLSRALLRGADSNIIEGLIARLSDEGTLADTDRSGFNCLAYAIAGEQPIALLERLVDRKVDPTVINVKAETLLHLAASLSRPEVVACLLGRCKVDPDLKDRDGRKAVELAVLNGDVTTLRAFMAGGVRPDGACVALAARRERIEMVNFLVEERPLGVSGRDENGSTGFLNVVQKGHLNLVKYFLSHGSDLSEVDRQQRNCLHLAAANNRSEVLKYLLRIAEERQLIGQLRSAKDLFLGRETLNLILGADKGRSAWHYIDVNRWLAHAYREELKSGNIDVDQFGVSRMGGFGEAPSRQETKTMHERLDERLEPRMAEPDMTPLHLAAFHDHREPLELLLAAGADPNVQDKFGLTPLHLAAMRGNMAAVKALEAKDAKFDVKDNGDRLASEVAALNGYFAVENYIEGRACFDQAKSIKDSLLSKLDELSPDVLNERRRNGEDLRRYVVSIFRDMDVDIKVACFELGIGPVMQESEASSSVNRR